MRYEDSTTQGVVRHAEPRHLIDLPAAAIFDEGDPVEARLVNLSRHGFRLVLPGRYDADTPFRLEVAGWPRLVARVVWNDGGRLGCLFAEPPAPKVFAEMCRATAGIDRDAF